MKVVVVNEYIHKGVYTCVAELFMVMEIKIKVLWWLVPVIVAEVAQLVVHGHESDQGP